MNKQEWETECNAVIRQVAIGGKDGMCLDKLMCLLSNLPKQEPDSFCSTFEVNRKDHEDGV